MCLTMQYRLSFCIPTFNFGAFIGQTLDSIISQATDDVQIVIVDGGSTDDTADIVERYKREFGRIKFIRRGRRYGIDLDILETVSQADGEYCWLLSSDDVLRPNAIERILNVLNAGDYDVVMVGFDSCTVDMSRIDTHPISGFKEPVTLDLARANDRERYFTKAITTTAFFSFISDVIVRRSTWQDTPVDSEFIGSCWIIASKLFSASRSKLKLFYDPAVYLDKRGDNDSFSSAGVVKRLRLSICGFRELGLFYFGDTAKEYREIERVLRNEYTFYTMLYFKLVVARSGKVGDRQQFLSIVDQHWKGVGLLPRFKAIAIRFAPIWFLAVLYRVYTVFRRLMLLKK